MTTITFTHYPTQTDRYRERIYRAVVNQPGITHTELGRQLGYLDASQRRGLIAELIAAGRVDERRKLAHNGQYKPTYWPAVAA